MKRCLESFDFLRSKLKKNETHEKAITSTTESAPSRPEEKKPLKRTMTDFDPRTVKKMKSIQVHHELKRTSHSTVLPKRPSEEREKTKSTIMKRTGSVFSSVQRWKKMTTDSLKEDESPMQVTFHRNMA